MNNVLQSHAWFFEMSSSGVTASTAHGRCLIDRRLMWLGGRYLGVHHIVPFLDVVQSHQHHLDRIYNQVFCKRVTQRSSEAASPFFISDSDIDPSCS